MQAFSSSNVPIPCSLNKTETRPKKILRENTGRRDYHASQRVAIFVNIISFRLKKRIKRQDFRSIYVSVFRTVECTTRSRGKGGGGRLILLPWVNCLERNKLLAWSLWADCQICLRQSAWSWHSRSLTLNSCRNKGSRSSNCCFARIF